MRDEFRPACDLQVAEVDCLGSAKIVRGWIVLRLFLLAQIKHKVARIETDNRLVIAARVGFEALSLGVVENLHVL